MWRCRVWPDCCDKRWFVRGLTQRCSASAYARTAAEKPSQQSCRVESIPSAAEPAVIAPVSAGTDDPRIEPVSGMHLTLNCDPWPGAAVRVRCGVIPVDPVRSTLRKTAGPECIHPGRALAGLSGMWWRGSWISLAACPRPAAKFRNFRFGSQLK